MYNLISFYTFIALLLFFVGMEIYRSRQYVKGYVIEFCPSKFGLDEFIAVQMKVQLQNGSVVKAEAPRCTMCLGDFTIGDEVYLTRTKDKYIINLPFKIRNKKSSQNRCAC